MKEVETIVFCLCSFFKVLFMSHCRNQRALFVVFLLLL